MRTTRRAAAPIVLDAYWVAGPKIAALTDAELGLWVRLLAASARRGDPNTGPAALQVRRLTSRRLARFVEIGLLEVVDGGYVVSGWDGHFPKDSTAAERKRRSRERAGARGPPPST